MGPLVKIVLTGIGTAGVLAVGMGGIRRGGRAVVLLGMAAVLIGAYAFCRAQLIPRHASEAQRAVLLTGDEPDYLLTAVSLAREHDLNVADNIARADYLLFQTRPVGGGDFDFFNRITKGRIAADRERWGDARYMQHRPGISATVAPVFVLAGSDYRWWAYVLISSLLVLTVVGAWSAAVRYGTDRGLAGVACLGTALGPPVLFYANQVYPEVVAGCLLLMAVLACMAGGIRVWCSIPALMAVVWFTDRALPLFAVLALTALWRLPAGWSRRVAGLLLAGNVCLFGLYCQHRFGLPLPMSHNEIFDCSIVLVPRRLFQILFDGMQGWVWLFPPVLLLPALAWSLVKERPLPVVPLALLVALLLGLAMVASFGDWRGGTNPRGRYYVIPQLLLLPLWFHWFRSGSGIANRTRTRWFLFLVTFTLIPLCWVARTPSWWYRPYHPFFGWEPIQRYYAWIPSLPDDAGWREWLKLLGWLPVLLIPSAACIRAAEQGRDETRPSPGA